MVADVIRDIGVEKVDILDGNIGIINVQGQKSIMYELRVEVEIVIDGEGKMIQFANLTSESNTCELNQNEANLDESQISALVESIKLVME